MKFKNHTIEDVELSALDVDCCFATANSKFFKRIQPIINEIVAKHVKILPRGVRVRGPKLRRAKLALDIINQKAITAEPHLPKTPIAIALAWYTAESAAY